MHTPPWRGIPLSGGKSAIRMLRTVTCFPSTARQSLRSSSQRSVTRALGAGLKTTSTLDVFDRSTRIVCDG